MVRTIYAIMTNDELANHVLMKPEASDIEIELAQRVQILEDYAEELEKRLTKQWQ